MNFSFVLGEFLFTLDIVLKTMYCSMCVLQEAFRTEPRNKVSGLLCAGAVGDATCVGKERNGGGACGVLSILLLQSFCMSG